MKDNANRFRTQILPRLAMACAVASVATLAGGCTDSSNGARAELGRPRTLAINGQSMFIGATTNPRMRVYSFDNHKVVRAPNPIFSLSVPTIELPQVVASYRSPDGTVSSPYVVSLSPMGALLTVASAKHRVLSGYTHVPGVPLAMDVMALASAEDDTVVPIATLVDGKAELYQVTIPASLADASIDMTALAPVRVESVDISGTIPQNLKASPADPAILAVADRAGSEEGVLLVNLESGAVTPVATHAPVADMAFSLDGTRLFALIDSDACVLARKSGGGEASGSESGTGDDPSSEEPPESDGDSGAEGASAPFEEDADEAEIECIQNPDGDAQDSGAAVASSASREKDARGAGTKASLSYTYYAKSDDDDVEPGSEGYRAGIDLGDCTGLLAIDVASGTLVKETPLPVPGILRTLAAGGPTELELPDGSKRTIDPFVLVASTEGSLYPVDGDSVSLVEAVEDDLGVTVTHVDVNGKASYSETSIEDVAVNPLRSPEETVSVFYEGRLPDFRDRPGLLAASGLLAQGAMDFAAHGVEVGDRVELKGSPKGCGPFSVAGMSSGALSLEGDIPEKCLGQVVYDIRAAGHYLVTGSITGFMGRVAEGESFVFEGPAPYDFGGGDASTEPALAFTMTGVDHTIGAGWTIEIKPGVAPYNLPLSALTLPTAMACDAVSGDFYVAYQGGNYLLRVVPSKLEHESVSTTHGLSVFR